MTLKTDEKLQLEDKQIILIQSSPMSSRILFYVISLVVVLAYIASHVSLVESILLPPRIVLAGSEEFPDKSYHNSSLLADGALTHPRIDVLGDTYLDVVVNSKAYISVTLNQAISSGDVEVQIKAVNDTRNLITFIDPKTGNKQSNIIITYPKDTFRDQPISFETNDRAGVVVIAAKVTRQPSPDNIDDSMAFIEIRVARQSYLITLSYIIGWSYFAAWSSSFYAQVILNYRRKSVVGLNFDFLFLNVDGFLCYSIFYLALIFSQQVRDDYNRIYPYSRVPADYNDLAFALHALVLTLITSIQCFIYERADQRISKPALGFFVITLASGLVLYVINQCNLINIYVVIYYLAIVKFFTTLIKFIPQALMNYRRKATTGWSIHNILLDFLGGCLSIGQMFILAYNYDDYISIVANFIKFCLGLSSISFDILFMVQHYILYNKQEQDEPIDGPDPVLSESIRRSNYESTNERLAKPHVSEKSDDGDSRSSIRMQDGDI